MDKGERRKSGFKGDSKFLYHTFWWSADKCVGLWPAKRKFRFFGLHIHEFGDCSLPFNKTGNHYNPHNVPHPEHSGDLIPLIGNNGFAWIAFYTERFTIDEIIDKSIVIHSERDDFTSQPSGNSGTKIACGVIKKLS